MDGVKGDIDTDSEDLFSSQNNNILNWSVVNIDSGNNNNIEVQTGEG